MDIAQEEKWHDGERCDGQGMQVGYDHLVVQGEAEAVLLHHDALVDAGDEELMLNRWFGFALGHLWGGKAEVFDGCDVRDQHSSGHRKDDCLRRCVLG
jgi:hypothetical protein